MRTIDTIEQDIHDLELELYKLHNYMYSKGLNREQRIADNKDEYLLLKDNLRCFYNELDEAEEKEGL